MIGFAAAYIGGRVCARLAHDARAATIVIAVVIVLGVVSAPMPVEVAVGPRPDDAPMIEATAGGRQPAWLSWLNPLIGVAGVWLGSRRVGRVAVIPKLPDGGQVPLAVTEWTNP